MSSLLSKNCVTSGDLGYFCLICRTYLFEEDDARAHIKQPWHKTNLKTTTYFSLYKCEGIRYVAGIYYCEICDLMMPCYQALNIHLKLPNHPENKKKMWEMFPKNCVITSEIGFYCLPCSTSLHEDNALEHIEDPTHKVKAKSCLYVEKYEGDSIRDVKGAYFCEMCNMTIHPMREIGIHLKETEHLLNKRRYYPESERNNKLLLKRLLEALHQKYDYYPQSCTVTDLQ